MTYIRMKKQIQNGAFTRAVGLDMLDAFLMRKRITVEQYKELSGMLPKDQQGGNV
ncbi:MAG: hypothetical protein RSA12_04775 [Clostridia bacterium]